ncbi:MAG: hypothetical protein P4M09_30560 [Devosia sp.]|nr:hypothetical protein [Devosia sp.]
MPADTEPRDLDLFLRRRRRRSIALGLVLAALVILFYVLTFVKMSLYHQL